MTAGWSAMVRFLALMWVTLTILASPAMAAPPTANVLVGQTFIVSLTSNPSTGFNWSVKPPSGVTVVARQFVSPRTTALGVPGREIFTLKATAEGSRVLRFVYRRPWLKNSPPAHVFKINLQVGHQTSVEETHLAVFYIHPNDRIRINLPSNPSTGYNWTLDDKGFNHAVLDFASSTFIPARGRLKGAPGTQAFEFRAVAPGATTVLVSYGRAGVQAAKIYNLVVTVEK